MEEYARTKRISQAGTEGANGLCDLLSAASDIARGTLESMQTLAGTASCKGVQVAALEKWSKASGCWYEDVSALGEFSDRGSENEVYASYDSQTIFKLNDFRYSDDNLTPFFERIEAHNHYFGYCCYEFVGMARNREGVVCAVLRQPFINADREATIAEIHDELERLGFHSEYDGECFTNGEHDIYDALPNNVLHGYDGNLYFIDTIIYKSSSGSFNAYKAKSPRFSAEKN